VLDARQFAVGRVLPQLPELVTRPDNTFGFSNSDRFALIRISCRSSTMKGQQHLDVSNVTANGVPADRASLPWLKARQENPKSIFGNSVELCHFELLTQRGKQVIERSSQIRERRGTQTFGLLASHKQAHSFEKNHF
jgi:hypothetical protein